MNIAEVLQRNYLFHGLSGDQVQSITKLAEEVTVDGGEVVVRQFDRSTDLIVILKGGLAIKTSSDEVIAELGAGSAVGEVSLVDDQPRSATATAIGLTTLAKIDGTKLRELMDEDASLRAQLVTNIARLLAQRLRTANIQLDAALGNL